MNSAAHAILSNPATAFDGVARSYDELFTETAIGRAQRAHVWDRLLSAFPQGSRILELNCGTGEDARFLSKRGRSVLACDASAEMIEVARNQRAEDGPRRLDFLQIANEELRVLVNRGPFGGAFSNFSGLNCVADLRPVARDLATLVIPGGRVLLCLWSPVCVFEVLWYLLHGQPKKAVRRFSGRATATLGGKTISVFYPTAGEVQDCFAPWFQLSSQCAVGLFVPPSYAERSMHNRGKLLQRLQLLDRLCAEWPIFRGVGDHMLLEFVRCNP